MFGNVNYSKTYIRGDVVRALDSRKAGASEVSKCDGIFRVNQEKNTIFYDNTQKSVLPNWGKSTSSFTYADSLNVRDSQAVRGSTTYMPDAMGVALNSSAVEAEI
jgi:hypothetical protein|mmetsp:Transcript_24300/g.48405  ORF Transcript_24300/g.48405 Transcript_24300/m.48405 type:complete len:105 (+) Transcript_24300:352-666(+)